MFHFGSRNKSYFIHATERQSDLESIQQIYGNNRWLKLSVLGTLDCNASFAVHLLLEDIGSLGKVALNHAASAVILHIIWRLILSFSGKIRRHLDLLECTVVSLSQFKKRMWHFVQCKIL